MFWLLLLGVVIAAAPLTIYVDPLFALLGTFAVMFVREVGQFAMDILSLFLLVGAGMGAMKIFMWLCGIYDRRIAAAATVEDMKRFARIVRAEAEAGSIMASLTGNQRSSAGTRDSSL